MKHRVGRAADLPPGSRTLVTAPGGRAIALLNIDGEYFALNNACPHMGGPLVSGEITGTTCAVETSTGRPRPQWGRDRQILACPWHHWEFDVATGRTIFDPGRRVRTYATHVAPRDVESFPVLQEGDYVFIELPGPVREPAR